MVGKVHFVNVGLPFHYIFIFVKVVLIHHYAGMGYVVNQVTGQLIFHCSCFCAIT